MRVILRRNTALSFGQDRRAAAAIASLPLAVAELRGDSYELPCATSDISLIISFNCNHPAESELIATLPPEVPVVIHWQLQPSFLDNDRARERAGVALRRAACVVVPALFMRSSLRQEFGVSRTVVIRNGVDLNVFHPKDFEARSAYRAGLGIPPTATVVAWVAQATPAKGIRALGHLAKMLPSDTVLLLRSFSRSRRHRAAQLVPELDHIRLANPAQVRVQPEDWLGEHHPTPFADALLVTSLSEVAPLVVTEALLSGVPAITSDCTPFYDELQAAGLGSDVHRLPLEAATVGLSRPHLDLTDAEANALAQHIARVLVQFRPPNSEARRDRSRKAQFAGMTQIEMLSQFEQLWNRVSSHRAV